MPPRHQQRKRPRMRKLVLRNLLLMLAIVVPRSLIPRISPGKTLSKVRSTSGGPPSQQIEAARGAWSFADRTMIAGCGCEVSFGSLIRQNVRSALAERICLSNSRRHRQTLPAPDARGSNREARIGPKTGTAICPPWHPIIGKVRAPSFRRFNFLQFADEFARLRIKPMSNHG